MSAAAGKLAAAPAQPLTTERNPRMSRAIGAEVLRAVASLDVDSRVAVLRWALVAAQRQTRPKWRRAGVAPSHPVTQGAHDAELLQWTRQGLPQWAMAARLGCSRTVVNVRVVALKEAGR